MTKHYAACSACTRIIPLGDKDRASMLVSSHNIAKHNGQQVAKVVGPTEEDVLEYLDYVEDECYTHLFEKMRHEIIRRGFLDDHLQIRR